MGDRHSSTNRTEKAQLVDIILHLRMMLVCYFVGIVDGAQLDEMIDNTILKCVGNYRVAWFLSIIRNVKYC